MQNNYSSPSTPQPYDTVSSLQPSTVWSPSSLAFCLELYTNSYLPEPFCYLMLLYIPSRQQHTGILCYWQLLVVKTKDSEVIKEVDYTQHNLHSVSSNTTSSHFAVFIFCQVCCLITDSAVSLFDITAFDVYIEMSHFSVIFVSVTFKIALPCLSRPAFVS